MKKTIFYFALILFVYCIQIRSESFGAIAIEKYLILHDGGSLGTISIESNALIANAPINPLNVTVIAMDISEYSSGQLLQTWQGCNQSSCSYNIAMLQSGKYIAKAYFSNGTTATLVFVK